MAQRPHRWDPVCPPAKGLVRPLPLDPTGVAGPTRGQARSRRWRRTSLGYYVPADTDSDVVEQRILETAMLLPAFGAVTGWASCRLSRAGFFDGLGPDGVTRRDVVLAVGHLGHIRQRVGVAVSRERLLPGEIVRRYGIRCTHEQRALFDEMRYAADVGEAVVAMDMMAAAELVSIRQMRVYLANHPGWTGVPQARAALDLAHEESRSPNETRMRLVWQLDAGLPPPLVNQPVFDLRGRLIGVPDLLDPVAGVVGEFDGAEHRRAGRHRRDVAREDAFRGHGLEYFKVVGLDLADVPLVCERMHSARSRARWLPERSRRWTLQPPPGWGEVSTLDQRLELQALVTRTHQEVDRQIAHDHAVGIG